MDNKPKDPNGPIPSINGELEHLDKHEELKNQFDYSGSQVNELDIMPAIPAAQAPAPISPAPIVGSTPPQLGSPIGVPADHRPVDTTIGLLRNWGIIIGTFVVFFVAGTMLNDALYAIYASILWPLYCLLLGLSLRTLLKKADDTLTEKERSMLVLVTTMGTIVSQFVYYIALRKKKPTIAHIAVRIGWKIFVVWIVYIIIFLVAYVSQSWEFQHSETFNAGIATLKQDANELSEAAKKQDENAVRAKCQAMVTHTQTLQDIPAYPDKDIQSDISSGENKIINGGGNCVRAINVDDVGLATQAAQEILDGAKQLSGAVKTANER